MQEDPLRGASGRQSWRGLDKHHPGAGVAVRMLLGAGLALAFTYAGTTAASTLPQPEHQPNLYRVGATGIHCYQEPCPRMGIVAADTPRALHPLWSGKAPPLLHGTEDDRRRIVAAWEAGECVIVRGNLLPNAALKVRQVIGPC